MLLLVLWGERVEFVGLLVMLMVMLREKLVMEMWLLLWSLALMLMLMLVSFGEVPLEEGVRWRKEGEEWEEAAAFLVSEGALIPPLDLRSKGLLSCPLVGLPETLILPTSSKNLVLHSRAVRKVLVSFILAMCSAISSHTTLCIAIPRLLLNEALVVGAGWQLAPSFSIMMPEMLEDEDRKSLVLSLMLTSVSLVSVSLPLLPPLLLPPLLLKLLRSSLRSLFTLLLKRKPFLATWLSFSFSLLLLMTLLRLMGEVMELVLPAREFA